MELSIQQLYKERKSWVEASRKNGFEDGIKRLLTDLYPDNAHFIYELLQNAEDAGASEVRFILNEESMEFEHNGSRLFCIEDVNSITSIGDSTKKDDPTNIGKFGVGFKAVFAYTNTPEIHSGRFHFRIRDLVVPDTENLPTFSIGEKITRFIFPFDNPKKSKETARIEIERNLRKLNENTLLFLSNILKIEYILPDLSLGFIERIEQIQNRIAIIVQHPETTEPNSILFLRFDKKVDVLDENQQVKSCRIAVAFSIMENPILDEKETDKRSKHKKNAQWEIKPLEHGQVCIYFPADKETSNLKFHIHAPFASTVARDSVRDCSSNNELRDHLAELIAESMLEIRDQGLLTVSFLATLPNDKDNLSPFYKPMQRSLIEIFKHEELTPMKIGGHAAASGIFRGSALLSNLINDEDMATIMGDNFFSPMWVANPPQKNQREDNFLSSLDITEWTVENLVNALNNQPDHIQNWLQGKSDEWHQELYALLGDFLSNATPYYVAQGRKTTLTQLQIIRISNGTYSTGKNCFFPNDEVEDDPLMPRVAKRVYTSGKNENQQKKAKEFLEAVGVREVGEAEQVEMILKNRYSQKAVDRKSFNPKLKDIKRFIALVEKEPSQANLFKDYFILKLSDNKWGKPYQAYLDSPFHNTGLKAYYEALGDKAECWALSTDYINCGISPDKIGSFAIKVGAIDELIINKVSCNNNPESVYLLSGPGGHTYNRVDIDYTIDKLDKLLINPNINLSLLLWNTMCALNEEYLKASYRNNANVSFRYADSQLVYILKNAAWIPQENDHFVKPCDALQEQLPKEFLFNEGKQWLKVVEFGISAKRKSEEYNNLNNQVQRMGFASAEEAEKLGEIVSLCRKQGIAIEELITSLKPKINKTRPVFPTKETGNPERRKEKFIEQFADANAKEYEERMRTMRTTRATIDPNLWLRNHYTNEDYKMVCQICKEEMPFKKRNKEYYFETVEMLSNKYFNKEHEAQFLALCPLCSAMFKEFIKSDDNAMKKLIDDLYYSVSSEIPLKLGVLETSIRFVDRHWQDMKMILEIDKAI
ncbi:MAG: hypothetical protein HQK63_14290 [Desulfamplus sp.]|nr:hypothetical protein [Desulfamplus sp.]